jgi:hypothetical protein
MLQPARLDRQRRRLVRERRGRFDLLDLESHQVALASARPFFVG